MAEQSVSQGFFIFQTLTCLFSIDIDLISACPWNPWSFAFLEMKREMQPRDVSCNFSYDRYWGRAGQLLTYRKIPK